MKSDIEIKVTTKHYRAATSYMDNNNCPLGIAVKEHFGLDKVYVGGVTVDIGIVGYYLSDNWGMIKESFVNERIARAKSGKRIPTMIVKLIEL